MAITLEKRPKRTYPFGLFHTPSSSTYRQKMESKGLKHLNMFPRKYQWPPATSSKFQKFGLLSVTRTKISASMIFET